MGLGIAAQQSRIAAFSTAGDHANLLITGAGAGRFPQARLVRASLNGGGARDLEMPMFGGQAVALSGDLLFVAGSPQSSVRNLSTERVRAIPTEGQHIVYAALSGERVAVVSENGPGMSSLVSIFDLRTGAKLGSIPYPAVAMTLEISWAGPDMLLAIEGTTLNVTEVVVRDNRVSKGSTYRLSGDEADYSFSNDRRRSGGLSGKAAAKLFLAHFPGEEGKQWFMLSPFRPAEGLRLVEYDARGTQLRTFRVRAENEGATKALRPNLIAYDAESFTLVGYDGIVRTFKRM